MLTENSMITLITAMWLAEPERAMRNTKTQDWL